MPCKIGILKMVLGLSNFPRLVKLRRGSFSIASSRKVLGVPDQKISQQRYGGDFLIYALQVTEYTAPSSCRGNKSSGVKDLDTQSNIRRFENGLQNPV